MIYPQEILTKCPVDFATGRRWSLPLLGVADAAGELYHLVILLWAVANLRRRRCDAIRWCKPWVLPLKLRFLTTVSVW